MLKEIINKFQITKDSRILKYLNNLEKFNSKLSKKDLELVEELKDLLNFKIKKINRYYFIQYLFYFLIYASFFSFLFSDLFIINEIYLFITKIVGVIGTAFFVIGLFIINKILELYFQDLNLISSTIISIYSKYLNEESVEILKENYYSTFIDFFRTKFRN
jgi:hypothetical protein